MGTTIIILLSLLAIATGAWLSCLVWETASLRFRFAVGALVGLALLAWIGFLSALAFGLNRFSILLTAVILAAGLAALVGKVPVRKFRAGLENDLLGTVGLIYYLAWATLLVWLFSRVVMFYPDGLHTSPANNFGDLPFHFGVITSMAYGENLPPQSPIFAGLKFTYPYLIDFLTAFFIRCGADWRAAFFVENIALALALVLMIELMTLRITQNRIAGFLAPFIVLFNGGFGFINFFRQLSAFFNDPAQAKFGLVHFLANLPNAYTMNVDLDWGANKIPLRWGNVFTTLLIPQRSMLFGLPLVALIILLWWMALGEQERGGKGSPRRRYLFAAGVLAGLLPMLHAHGFFSIAIACVPMALLFFSIDWLAFFVPMGLLAAPQALYLSGTQVKNELFKVKLFWEAGDTNPALFWAANAGLFILLLAICLLANRLATLRQVKFYLPFLLWFIVPNVIKLAPWDWDNIKVLVYWALASSAFVALTLAVLLAHRFKAIRLVGAVLLVGLVLSGTIDVVRALSPVENVPLFGKAELEVAELIRQRTPPRAVILHAPIHNSVVALTGRQSVMGYPGHLWTHGIAYNQRENEVRMIYRGGAESARPLVALGIDYVVIGPAERYADSSGEMTVAENYFAESFPVVIDHAGYKVYQIKPR
ncbi:MAG: hypothetical protein JST85_18755 [Acidobacteria bacterium]|nr:hypothetical protein [Acidobacteriota bacterium]